MAAIKATNFNHHQSPPAGHHHRHHRSSNNVRIICGLQDFTIDNAKEASRKKAIRLAQSISNLIQLQIERKTPNFHSNIDIDFRAVEMKQNTPAMSPRENISEKWNLIRGCDEWENLLDPLHPWLRREILKYGEFAQATYDAFDFDSFSEYRGSCRYNPRKLFGKLGLTKHGYNISKYIYAMSQMDNIPAWLEKSNLVGSWSKDSNWMGFVAVSGEEESKRIGRRDIVVAWRGTVAPTEMYEDMQKDMEPVGPGEAKVERGFLNIYKSKCARTRYNKNSASEQVTDEIKRLVRFYEARGEEVSLTLTGHSLGGALALLTAYEVSTAFPTLPVSVISFGAPRVGNIGFRDELHQRGVKVLRVVIKQDLVPRMPGIVLNESLQKFDDLTGSLEWVYHHVGSELRLDIRSSPYLKGGSNFIGIHDLETYLHLVDGFVSSASTFRGDARRDVALVNKCVDMLVNEMGIPPCWYQLSNKGLVCNEHGRWVKPKRDPEDVPSPNGEGYSIV